MTTNLKKIEEEIFYENDDLDLPPSDIISYNELRSCADLFRMYKAGVLDIQPEFQREFVWKSPDQTRFIDSLVKQLPIPSMCFSLDYKTQKWQVIDGLQRMSTIIRFLDDDEWTLSKLDDIDQQISGVRISNFKKPNTILNPYFLRVENLTLPITVLRCDFTKESHLKYLFTIFHRLNTGGYRLNNQEIRNCIYAGEFNSFIKNINENDDWKTINGISKRKVYRMKHAELILRFFAFEENIENYPGRLAKFLNEYMYEKRDATQAELDAKRVLFSRTMHLVNKRIAKFKSMEKMPLTIFEAILFGVGKNIDKLEASKFFNPDEVLTRLLADEGFSEINLKSGLMDKDKLVKRLNVAKHIFGNI